MSKWFQSSDFDALAALLPSIDDKPYKKTLLLLAYHITRLLSYVFIGVDGLGGGGHACAGKLAVSVSFLFKVLHIWFVALCSHPHITHNKLSDCKIPATAMQ